MYLADALRDARLRRPGWRRVATGNVVGLGLVSLATDVSSEMVTAVLPAYLVLGLHLSFAQYGLLDGIYTWERRRSRPPLPRPGRLRGRNAGDHG